MARQDKRLLKNVSCIVSSDSTVKALLYYLAVSETIFALAWGNFACRILIPEFTCQAVRWRKTAIGSVPKMQENKKCNNNFSSQLGHRPKGRQGQNNSVVKWPPNWYIVTKIPFYFCNVQSCKSWLAVTWQPSLATVIASKNYLTTTSKTWWCHKQKQLL